MRLKTKPKKPKNEIVRKKIDVEDWTIQNILNHLDSHGISYEDANISVENISDWDYSEDAAYLTYNSQKYTDEEYLEELKKYEEKLRKYNEWYKDNEEEIKRKLKEKEEKEIAKKEKEKARLQKQVAKIEKQLKELE